MHLVVHDSMLYVVTLVTYRQDWSSNSVFCSGTTNPRNVCTSCCVATVMFGSSVTDVHWLLFEVPTFAD